MPAQQTVLLVGGTGRTGRRALRQLLDRGVSVRAIVRSGGKLPPDVAGNSSLTVIEASLLSLRDEALQQHLRGCDAVILGCTETPLIMNDRNSPLPTLDSTRLLARAALHRAVQTKIK